MQTISINFIVPQGWHELSDKQLRYVYQLPAQNFTSDEVKTLCLLLWTGTKVTGKQNGDGKYTSITLEQSFNLYGLFVDYATSSYTPRGNPDDLGRDLADTVSNALSRNFSRRFVT